MNGLNIYYEIHGTGSPLVLLHGGFMTVGALGPLLPALAASRQVIAIELEGHGHTADLDRPLSLNQMAEDVAGLVKQCSTSSKPISLVLAWADKYLCALQCSTRRLVRKLVVVSSPYNNDGFYPAIVASWPSISAEGFVGTPMESIYAEAAPQPEHWSAFIGKMKSMMMGSKGWSADEVRSIQAPTLLVVGDADIVRPEHTLEMLRLLGGAGPDVGMRVFRTRRWR